jgi:hypothetical protein
MVTWNDDTQAAWELYAAELAKLPGVLTVATGRRILKGRQTREPAVVVTVARKLSPDQLTSSTIVPKELRLPDGSVVRTDVVEDPSFVFSPDQDSAAYRPVPGGCEIGPFGSAFLGTLGGWFCAPRRGGGWNPVWLTNAHVADTVTLSTIPADPRMTQPWGGTVIGNTTAISGWPNPLPGPGVTVGGVTDAAIGVLDAGVNPDYQVLQIAPAPFEIGTVTAGMGVQKRGRTTRLRTGTVVTQPGGGPFLSANVNSPAGGQVTFGLPGQPRLFRITSPGMGLGVAFGMPGDSGSLVFGTAAGRLQSTFPCVGLYFAGNGAWVSQQANPNNFTVTGLAFDITNVMAQLNLDTVCTCVVRSILEAIFGRQVERASSVRASAAQAERMMKRFRDGVLANSSTGKVIADAIAETAPDVSRVLALDPVSFGLAVDLLEPWAKASTSLAVMKRSIDEQTVSTATELVERVSGLAPETAKRLKPLLEGLRKSEGMPVQKLIGSYRPPAIPPIERAKPSTGRTGSTRKRRT